jgi:hypothetical protein
MIILGCLGEANNEEEQHLESVNDGAEDWLTERRGHQEKFCRQQMTGGRVEMSNHDAAMKVAQESR